MQRPVLSLAAIFMLVGGACSAQPLMTDEAYAGLARQRLEARLSARGPFRIISIAANAALDRACAWIEIGGRPDALLFEVDAMNSPFGAVFVSDPARGTLPQRVAGAFNRVLGMMSCEDAQALPPTPPNAGLDPTTRQRLAALWDKDGPKWAIIPAPGVAGFVGVRRRAGGGQIITPLFPTEREVQAWIDTGGDAKAEAENAAGRAAMAAFDDCLTKAPDTAAKRACSSEGMDRTVQLQ